MVIIVYRKTKHNSFFFMILSLYFVLRQQKQLSTQISYIYQSSCLTILPLVLLPLLILTSWEESYLSSKRAQSTHGFTENESPRETGKNPDKSAHSLVILCTLTSSYFHASIQKNHGAYQNYRKIGK